MKLIRIFSMIVLLLLPLLAAAAETTITYSEGLSPPDPNRGRDCDDVKANHDGTFEGPYGWSFDAVAPPNGGAFAERFSGPFEICEIQLFLGQTGNQSGQTLDIFVWQDDHTGNPGELVAQLTGIDPGLVSTWPVTSVHTIPLSVTVEGDWWVGVWGNWPGAELGWYLGADENGPGTGDSRTMIVSGQGYPTGWNHPGIVSAWSECQSLGISVKGTIPGDPPLEPGCGEVSNLNHDGSLETAFAWAYSGISSSEYGAFAEGFTGEFDICEVQLSLTQIGNQAGQTLDVFVWEDDHTGNPGSLIAHLSDIDPGPVAQWPEISRHNIPLVLSVEDDWWVGYRGNWPGAQAGWSLAVDDDGPGGNSRTNIGPGQGYPIGWNHPGVVPAWQYCQSLGIEVSGAGGTPAPDGSVPAPLALHQNSPNPFNPGTTIRFELAEAGTARLEIIDVTGRAVATLIDGFIDAGHHEVHWRGQDDDGVTVSSGIYLYRLISAGAEETRKMIMLQ